MTDLLSNPSALGKVTDAHQKGLATCLQKIDQWQKFKADYEALKQRLITLPDKLAYNIMVPMTQHAFMPGTLVDTNRVTVLLGDNWFAEVSTKQASEIAERRIKQCTNMLDNLQKEKKGFETWLGYITDFSSSDLVEIQEEYDPEKEKLWREQHAKNVREHMQKLAAERQTQAKSESSDNDELDNLEKYFSKFIVGDYDDEEDEDDLGSSDEETSEETPLQSDKSEVTSEANSDSNHASCDKAKDETSIPPAQAECETNKELVHDNIQTNSSTNNNEKTVSNKPLQLSLNLDTLKKNADLAHNGNDHDNHDGEARHVRWIDLSEAKSRVITFSHSKMIHNNGSSKKKHQRRKRRNSSTSEKEEEEMEDGSPIQITSPSDIYKCFSFSMQQSMPKSILKTTSPTQPVAFSSSLDSTSSEDLSDMVNGTDLNYWMSGRNKPKLVNGMGKKFWAKNKIQQKTTRNSENEMSEIRNENGKVISHDSDDKFTSPVGDVCEHSGGNTANYSNLTRKQQKSLFKSRRK